MDSKVLAGRKKTIRKSSSGNLELQSVLAVRIMKFNEDTVVAATGATVSAPLGSCLASEVNRGTALGFSRGPRILHHNLIQLVVV